MGKPIAVLSSNFSETLQWMKKEFKIKRILMVSKIVITEDDKEYIIVSKTEQVRGWELAGYIIAPDYESLEQEVKSRIR